MQPINIIFTAKEILEQTHRELIKAGADLTNFSVDEWLQYIIARTIEDVLLVDITPKYNPAMENISAVVRSNYRRFDGEENFTIHHDIGSNKLLPHLNSWDLSFESQLELYRSCIIIRPRKPLASI